VKLVFMGSGAFGLPTLEALADEHEIVLVVSQPARPAGRSRRLTPTPIAAWADERGIDVFTPERLDDAAVDRIRAAGAEAHVVIAYGHKIPPALVDAAFSINLHASLLPRWRGAAPINHAMIAGDAETGVSVIGLAQRMDAGLVFAERRVPIDPRETAGELHDRLARLGPEAVAETLAAYDRGDAAAISRRQDEAAATRAPKLAKADGRLDFTRPARELRQQVHGLTPWPGCAVRVDEHTIKLLRVADEVAGDETGDPDAAPGTLLADGRIATGDGRLRPLEVQPAGGRAMSWDEFRRGRQLTPGMLVAPEG
jgi:methionyl-tRNA formyltransferase